MKFALMTLVLLGLSLALASAQEGRPWRGMRYLDNGLVKLGVDLSVGGAITYLSRSGDDLNLINSYDWGRQIQLSFYSGPVPYEPEGKKPIEFWAALGWNPIQSGDYAGNRARVVDFTSDGKQLYLKCIPMQWPLDNVPGDCFFEVWLALEGSAIQARCKLTNDREDKTQYSGRGQELPAVYLNAPWSTCVTYTGSAPFTGDALTEQATDPNPEKGGWVWSNPRYATENWAAFINAEGWGLGIYEPDIYYILSGFYEKPGVGGPKDNPISYLSPTTEDILDWNIEYEYSYSLILGAPTEIRDWVYARGKAPKLPRWEFRSDRQHWIYLGATDAGWPIEGELRISGKAPGFQLQGPLTFWRAEEAPHLYIKAAFSTPTTGQVTWERDGAPSDPAQNAAFEPLPDGKFHTYKVKLAGQPGYEGIGRRLRINLSLQEEAEVRVKAIWLGQ
jgi:hypothetical protein